jgi:NB-ARC domain
MVGEPDLHPNNEAQWLQLISECVSGGRPLSGHLANDRTVGSLEVIASLFEDACLYCTHFEIRSDARTSTRKKWKFSHKKHVGCVERATVCVRIFTTASDEQLLEAAKGGVEICGLHPKSGHSRNLLLTAGRERADQNVRIAIDTEEAHNDDATLSTPPGDETNIALTDADEAQGDLCQVGSSLCSGPDQLNASDIEGQAREELTPTILDELSTRESDLPKRPLNEASVIVPAISFSRRNQLLATDTIRNDVVADISTITITDESKTSAANTPRRRKRRLPLSSTMPPKCQYFIGRAAELDEISRYLLGSRFSEPGTSIDASVPRVICVSGMGGTGKTQLALEYCSRSLARYDTVLWINASTRSSLGRSFHDCAMLQGLVEGRVHRNHLESRDRVLSWCASSSKPWLLVLDALDECFENTLSSFVPRKGVGSVILTSRRELAVQGTMQHIEYIQVPRFSVAEATAVLRTQLHEGANPVHRKAITLAAQRYYAFPFALMHVVDWSRRERLSIRNIDDLLDGRDVALRFGHDTINQVLAVTRPRLSRRCGELFETMAFLDPDRIQHNVLLASQLHNCDQAAVTFVHASIEELWRSALCDVDMSGSFSIIHRSVAEWLQENMTDDAWDGALVRASRCLQRQWPQRRKLRNVIDGFWPEFSLLHSHLQHTANACLHGERHRLTDADDSLKQLLLTHSW